MIKRLVTIFTYEVVHAFVFVPGESLNSLSKSSVSACNYRLNYRHVYFFSKLIFKSIRFLVL